MLEYTYWQDAVLYLPATQSWRSQWCVVAGTIKASMLSAQSPSEPRKVCIAFEHMESGINMVSWAAKHCLFPDDDIHLVHMTNRVLPPPPPPVTKLGGGGAQPGP